MPIPRNTMADTVASHHLVWELFLDLLPQTEHARDFLQQILMSIYI